MEFIWTEGRSSFIALELCDRNLKQELERINYDPGQTKRYFSQIVKGMRALWQENVIHRDLKFENILVKDRVVKIADFGQSKFLGDRLEVESRRCGTPYTMAPEIFFNQGHRPVYEIKSDVWAMGVMLHEMLYRVHPFDGSVKRFERRERVQLKKRFGPCDELIDRCLKFEVEERIGWREFVSFCQHKLFPDSSIVA